MDDVLIFFYVMLYEYLKILDRVNRFSSFFFIWKLVLSAWSLINIWWWNRYSRNHGTNEKKKPEVRKSEAKRQCSCSFFFQVIWVHVILLFYFLCFCVYLFTFNFTKSGFSNLADSCVPGEFIPSLLLLSQNTRKYQSVGVLVDCLMYIDGQKVLIISLA